MFGSIDIEDLPYISLGFEDLKMKTHPPPTPCSQGAHSLEGGKEKKRGEGTAKGGSITDEVYPTSWLRNFPGKAKLEELLKEESFA